MFESGQYGKLYLESGIHARGRTFHIWVLPSDEPVYSPRGAGVEVYGVISGQPGWTESYGWLHHGKWEMDFAALVEKRLAEMTVNAAGLRFCKLRAEELEKQRIARLLESY